MSASSTEGIKVVLHPVSDLAAAKKVYAALLGMEPQADSPYYVGFDAAGQQIGLVPKGGPQAMASAGAYWQVADIEAKVRGVDGRRRHRDRACPQRRRHPLGGQRHRPGRKCPGRGRGPVRAAVVRPCG